MCDPHRLAAPGTECLVCSIGSENKFDFEEAVLKDIGPHCEVHTFDHTIGSNPAGRPDAVQFHPWGLGHGKVHGVTEAELARPDFIGLKTFEAMVTDLDHLCRPIHILKVTGRPLRISKEAPIPPPLLPPPARFLPRPLLPFRAPHHLFPHPQGGGREEAGRQKRPSNLCPLLPPHPSYRPPLLSRGAPGSPPTPEPRLHTPHCREPRSTWRVPSSTPCRRC